MQVFDMRGSPQSVKLCAKDAQELCGGVKPGEGRLHACLQRNLERLRCVGGLPAEGGLAAHWLVHPAPAR
jgi:hypothetical protein